MKKRAQIYQILMITFLFIIISSCKKDDENPINQTNGKTTAVFNSNLTYGTMTDQDGNIYKTIIIGTQTWMAENLRTTHYRNGDLIPRVTESTLWVNLTTGAYCNYNNTTSLDTIATRGRLYNWFAVSDIRQIAPKGWHVPTDAEWTILVDFLGGESIAGGKMKEIGTTHWLSENIGASNESGFTGLPYGCRYSFDGSYGGFDYNAFWWSSTEDIDPYVWNYYLNYNYSSVDRTSFYLGEKNSGFAVRCVKD